MKKFTKLALMLAFVLCLPVVLVACKAELESIRVDANTVKTTYVVGDTVDHENVKVYAKYSDGKEELVDNNDVTFSQLDVTTSGTKTLTITYQEKTTTVSVTVYNSINDTYQIVGFESPEFVNVYRTNIEEKDNKETEFYDRTQKFVVGDDNDFVFLPEITALNENNEPITLNAYKSLVKVYILNGTSYSELTGEDLTNYVAIDDERSTFNFTDSAVGKEFKIEVKPFYYQDQTAITFEFAVENGYNVYKASDLAIFENTRDIWDSYKADHQLTDVDAEALFFMNNISLTADDLSTSLIYQQGADDTNSLIAQYPNIAGSLKDNVPIYRRTIEEDETFAINGNNFTLDASAVPLIQKFNGGEEAHNQITHTELFRFVGSAMDESTYELKNLSYIGNAARGMDTTKAGGLIFAKCQKATINTYNMITRATAIAWFSTEYSEFNLDHVKSYDNYSQMIHTWRLANVNVTNSELKRCGGPVIIMNHDGSDDADAGTLYTTVNIDENSVIENFVSGEEPWFASLGVNAYVSLIKMLGQQLFEPMGKTIFKATTVEGQAGTVDLMNCKFAVYDGGSLLGAVGTTKAYVKNNTEIFDMTGGDPILATLRANLKGLANVPPIFQAGGVNLYFNGTGLASATGTPTQQELANFVAGTQLNIVLNATLAVGLEFMALEA